MGAYLDRNHFVYHAYRVYQYLIYYPVLFFATVFFGTMAILLSMMASSKAGSLMGVLWARIVSYMTPMTVKICGRNKVDPDKSYVVVANHQSQYDILVLYGWFPMDFKWVMKAELRRVPVLGYACYKMGHVFVNRAKSAQAVKSISAVSESIKEGTSIIFFPEGKRSLDGALLDFKKGAFVFALENNLPVLPVSLVNTGKILPKNSTALLPGRAELVFHDPISIEAYSHDNIHELMARARNAVEKGLGLGELEN